MNPTDGTTVSLRARAGSPAGPGAIRPAALAAAVLVAGSTLLSLLVLLLGPLAPIARARVKAGYQTIAGGTGVPPEATAPEAGAEGTPAGEAPGGETTEGGPISATATPEPSTVLSTGGLTLRTRSAALRGQVLDLSGSASTAEAGRTVVLERYAAIREAWVEVAHAEVASTGAVKIRWRPRIAGQASLRAAILPTAQASSRHGRRRLARAATVIGTEPTEPGSGTVTVYKPALATFFGPGLYGRKTACGEVLTRELIGVANRTLPCGTLVDVSYGGRHLSVPVVDRGPYSTAEWDLTSGAAEALGFTSTARIGTLVLGSALETPVLGVPTTPPVTPEATATGGAVAAA